MRMFVNSYEVDFNLINFSVGEKAVIFRRGPIKIIKKDNRILIQNIFLNTLVLFYSKRTKKLQELFEPV